MRCHNCLKKIEKEEDMYITLPNGIKAKPKGFALCKDCLEKVQDKLEDKVQ